jgi:hypothetical protein
MIALVLVTTTASVAWAQEDSAPKGPPPDAGGGESTTKPGDANAGSSKPDGGEEQGSAKPDGSPGAGDATTGEEQGGGERGGGGAVQFTSFSGADTRSKVVPALRGEGVAATDYFPPPWATTAVMAKPVPAYADAEIHLREKVDMSKLSEGHNTLKGSQARYFAAKESYASWLYWAGRGVHSTLTTGITDLDPFLLNRAARRRYEEERADFLRYLRKYDQITDEDYQRHAGKPYRPF